MQIFVGLPCNVHCNFLEKKVATTETYYLYLHRYNAEVAQLVELQPSKLVVASSSLVFRSKSPNRKVWTFFLTINRFCSAKSYLPMSEDRPESPGQI
jgi:hypothetical protein